MMADARHKAAEETAERDAKLKDAPAIWSGVLTRHDVSLQGHVMLRNVRAGAAVEILEENVGDENKYHMVRDVATGALGLHPAAWVSERPPDK